MAIANVISIIYTVQDAKNSKSRIHIHFPISAVNNLGIGVLDDFARTTATLIDNLLLGRVIAAKTTLNYDLSAESIKAAPLPNSDVQEGAIFKFLSNAPALARTRLATFDESFYFPGTKLVDMTNSDVDAFVQRIIQGRTIGLINVSPSDDHGNDIVLVLPPFEQFFNGYRDDE